MIAYPLVPLAEVLTQYTDYIDAPEPKIYPKLSVKLYGKGVVLDEAADGSLLKMKRHQIAKAGQVILSEIWGKKGAIGIVPSEGNGALCTSHFFLFDVRKDRLLPGYLQAAFTANLLEEQLGAEAKGTTGYAAVRPKHLLAARIPIPSISEQRRILSQIDRLTTKVTEARTLREEASAQSSRLLKAALHRIGHELQATGKLGNVLLDKPRNGWSAKCDNSEGGTPVLSLSAVTGFRYRATEFKRTSLHAPKGAHFWLRPGDLLITRSNTPELVGHAAIYSGTPSPCIYPDLMMRVPVKHDSVVPTFVWYWLQSPVVRDFISQSAKGTSPTMKKISQDVVMAIPFPTGISIQEQRQIVAELDGLQRRVDSLRQLQNQTEAELHALMPSILSKAFRGEL